MSVRQHVWCAVVLLIVLIVWYVDRAATWVFEDLTWMQSSAGPVAPAVWPVPRALMRWSWWAQVQLGQPYLAFRLVNLALFGLVLAEVWWLVRRVGLSAPAAWLAVAGVAVHPMSVEVAAYAAGRSELLAAIGVLAACLCASGGWWRLPVGIGIVLSLGLGIAGKESAVVGLGLVPLTVWVMDDRRRPRWAPAWMPVVIAASVALVAVRAYGGLRAVVNIELHSLSVTWSEWLLLQAAATQRLLSQVVWPSALTPDADLDQVGVAWRLGGLAVLLAAATGAWWFRRRRPVVAYGLAWCLVSVAPRFVVQTPRSYLNAHQFFLPFVGLVIAGVAWLADGREGGDKWNSGSAW